MRKKLMKIASLSRHNRLARMLALFGVALAVALGVPMMATQGQAQDVLPPAVVRLTFEIETPVTVPALERGEIEATLTWQTVGMSANYSLLLHYFQIDDWIPVVEESLPESGAARLYLQAPLDFGPVTYRLAVFDSLGRIVSQQIATIPYEEAGLIPSIAEFTTTSTAVDPVALSRGVATIPVAWRVENRLSVSNLVFEQIMPDGTVRSAELPRRGRWVGSAGEGVVSPIAPGGDAATVVIRLRVQDMRDGEVFQEATIELPIQGLITPSPGPTATQSTPVSIPPLETPTPTQTLPPGG